MPKALAWSLNMILGTPSASDAPRPSRWLLWLSVGHGLVSVVLFAFCLVLSLVFFRSPLAGGLSVGISYLLLTWRRLPVSRGGAYVLSGFLSPGNSSVEYDVFRRLGCYMGLLLLRVVLVFWLSIAYGPLWVFPVLLLSGCSLSGCLGFRPDRNGGDVSSSGLYAQWFWGLGVLAVFSLFCLWSSHGLRFLLSCVASGALCPLCCLYCHRLFPSSLGPSVFRRVCWTLSEYLVLSLFGVIVAL